MELEHKIIDLYIKYGLEYFNECKLQLSLADLHRIKDLNVNNFIQKCTEYLIRESAINNINLLCTTNIIDELIQPKNAVQLTQARTKCKNILNKNIYQIISTIYFKKYNTKEKIKSVLKDKNIENKILSQLNIIIQKELKSTAYNILNHVENIDNILSIFPKNTFMKAILPEINKIIKNNVRLISLQKYILSKIENYINTNFDTLIQKNYEIVYSKEIKEIKETAYYNELTIIDCATDIVRDMPELCYLTPEYIEYDKFCNASDETDFYSDYIKVAKNRQDIITRRIIILLYRLYPEDCHKIDRRNISNLIKNNFDKFVSYAVKEQFPTKESIKQLLKSIVRQKRQYEEVRKKIVKKVLYAYHQVEKWLKEEAPDLKLHELKENNIHIIPYDHASSAYCQTYFKIKNGEEVYCDLNIAKSAILKYSDTQLASTIYHELIHYIKNQSALVYKLENLRRQRGIKTDDDELQDISHTDKIWNRGADIVSRHTHLDVNNNYFNQYLSHKNKCLYKLNEAHEASLICYNCGWFDVYNEWNKDCDQALNGNFICPECHKDHVKLIPPGPGEKELLDDALAHLHYQQVEQGSYKPDKSRLKRQQQYLDELARYEIFI